MPRVGGRTGRDDAAGAHPPGPLARDRAGAAVRPDERPLGRLERLAPERGHAAPRPGVGRRRRRVGDRNREGVGDRDRCGAGNRHGGRAERSGRGVGQRRDAGRRVVLRIREPVGGRAAGGDGARLVQVELVDLRGAVDEPRRVGGPVIDDRALAGARIPVRSAVHVDEDRARRRGERHHVARGVLREGALAGEPERELRRVPGEAVEALVVLPQHVEGVRGAVGAREDVGDPAEVPVVVLGDRARVGHARAQERRAALQGRRIRRVRALHDRLRDLDRQVARRRVQRVRVRDRRQARAGPVGPRGGRRRVGVRDVDPDPRARRRRWVAVGEAVEPGVAVERLGRLGERRVEQVAAEQAAAAQRVVLERRRLLLAPDVEVVRRPGVRAALDEVGLALAGGDAGPGERRHVARERPGGDRPEPADAVVDPGEPG